MENEIIKIIEIKRKRIEELMYFNLEQMDKYHSDEKYYQQEYLQCYYQYHLLTDILIEIDELRKEDK